MESIEGGKREIFIPRQTLKSEDYKKYNDYQRPIPEFTKTTREHIGDALYGFFGPLSLFSKDIIREGSELRDSIKQEGPSQVAKKALKVSYSLITSGWATAAVTPLWLSVTPIIAPYYLIRIAVDIARSR